MKIVITGGAGFLGQRLVKALCQRGYLTDTSGVERQIEQIVAIDSAQTAPLHVDERVGYVVGDISSGHFASHVMGSDTHTVFHLAAVSSAEAEADFDLGIQVNLDGTRALLEACRLQKQRPKLIFASSVAVFGGALPAVVTDDSAALPLSSYGMHKLVSELLLVEYSRKNYVDGRALRLPTIVVRPGRPNAVPASFASSLIHDPLAGVDVVCPVAPHFALWIMSPKTAVAAMLHAHELPRARWVKDSTQQGGALNLPGLAITVDHILAAVERVGGPNALARIKFRPDPLIESIVSQWPTRFVTTRADTLGFPRDTDVERIVSDYLSGTAEKNL